MHIFVVENMAKEMFGQNADFLLLAMKMTFLIRIEALLFTLGWDDILGVKFSA